MASSLLISSILIVTRSLQIDASGDAMLNIVEFTAFLIMTKQATQTFKEKGSVSRESSSLKNVEKPGGDIESGYDRENMNLMNPRNLREKTKKASIKDLFVAAPEEVVASQPSEGTSAIDITASSAKYLSGGISSLLQPSLPEMSDYSGLTSIMGLSPEKARVGSGSIGTAL